MTKIKLANGTIINAETVEVVNGLLMISTNEHTVEELHELFSNKENTNHIVIMTEAETECGYKNGFTSFAGINYDANGMKTIGMFQPKDVTEARISNVEGKVAAANDGVEKAHLDIDELNETVNALLGADMEV